MSNHKSLRNILFFITFTALFHAPAAFSQDKTWYEGVLYVDSAVINNPSIPEIITEAKRAGLGWIAVVRPKHLGAYWKVWETNQTDRSPDRTVEAFSGFEWKEPPGLKNDQIIILGTSHAAPIPHSRLEHIIDYADREGGLVIFSNPSPHVFDTLHNWAGYKAFEGFSEGRWNTACEVGGRWDQLLTEGVRIFIIGRSDTFNKMSSGPGTVKTYVSAISNLPRDIIAGMRLGSMYVCERNSVKMDFSVDEAEMGGTVHLDGEYVSASISLKADFPITRISLVGNGAIRWSWSPHENTFTDTISLFLPQTVRYLRLIAETTKGRAMTNPVFISHESNIHKPITVMREEHPLARLRSYAKSAPEAKFEVQSILRQWMKMPGASSKDRMTAVQGLVEMDLPESAEGISEIMSDSSSAVRAYALRMLALENLQPKDKSWQTMQDDIDSRVRLWAVRAGERLLDHPEHILIQHLNDVSEFNKFAAIEGLADLARSRTTLYDTLTTLALRGHHAAAIIFQSAPDERKAKVVSFYQDRYNENPLEAYYDVLEHLGASPAHEYVTKIERKSLPAAIDGDIYIPTGSPTLTLQPDNGMPGREAYARVRLIGDDTRLLLSVSAPHLSGRNHNKEFVQIGFDIDHNGYADYIWKIFKSGRSESVMDGGISVIDSVDIKIIRGAEDWRIKIEMPLTQMDDFIARDENIWGFNVSHGISGTFDNLYSWAPTYGRTDDAGRFGDLYIGQVRHRANLYEE